MKKKLANKKQQIAALIIQTRFRGYLIRKWYLEVHRIRTSVAIRVQRLWRRYYDNIVLPRKQEIREQDGAPIVQKALRGYLARKMIKSDKYA